MTNPFATPEVSVTTGTNPGTTTAFERRQHAKVSFQTMSGAVKCWVDEDGWLVIQGEFGLIIRPISGNWINVREGH